MVIVRTSRRIDSRVGARATPSGLISNPPPSIPPIFTPDALPAATLPIYPGLEQAQKYAGLHTPVAWFLLTLIIMAKR